MTARHDYHPFGEEIGTLAVVPGSPQPRTTALGYTTDTVRKQFTGYERDNEINLDYANARYYKPAHGRYTSVDPMPIKKRHLLDPRDFNRYVYVANNPLKYIDPTGEEKIIIVVRTYIPAEKVTHPPGVGATFKGDLDKDGKRISSRTEQRFVVETDVMRLRPGKPDSEYSQSVGETVRLARGLGSMTGSNTATSDGSTLDFTITRPSGDSVTVNASGNEANPLIGGYTGSPGITYSFSITVQSPGEDGTVKVTVSGQHDGFPAYEIIVQRPDSGNVSRTVYLHDPNKTGDGPQSLYGSGEYYIADRETDIPSGRRPRR